MMDATSTGSRTSTALPEDILVTAAQGGDVEAFGELYKRYRGSVCGFVTTCSGSREDAEDLTQEVFCRAWRALPRFRRSSKLLTWLCRIAANACADAGRNNRRRRMAGTEVSLDEAAATPRAPDADPGMRSMLRQAVRDALDELPRSQRMLVVLCDVQGFTCSEAAQVLGCSCVSVRVRLCRARKRLRESLADDIEEVGWP